MCVWLYSWIYKIVSNDTFVLDYEPVGAKIHYGLIWGKTSERKLKFRWLWTWRWPNFAFKPEQLLSYRHKEYIKISIDEGSYGYLKSSKLVDKSKAMAGQSQTRSTVWDKVLTEEGKAIKRSC